MMTVQLNSASQPLPDIRTLVPHSGAMVLLDRVSEVDEESLVAEVDIEEDTLFCDGREVGAWIGVEYMAQAIAAHAGYHAGLRGESVKVGFLLGARRYECSRSGFAVGNTLKVRIQRALQGENGLAAFDCRIDLDEGTEAGCNANPNATPLAKATITVFQPDNVSEFLNGNNGSQV
jgi:predicted hotdog family 3-hydroxylacyl-ACP dehydratase